VLAATPALPQASQRAEPVTGPGVTTIGGIPADGRVSVRSGPAAVFPVVGTLGYGARVRKGLCLGGGSSQWCQVTAVDGSVEGFVSASFLVDGAAPPPGGNADGGPDYWEVRGLPEGALLGVRRAPDPSSPALATLREREVVRNLGCQGRGDGRWCRVRSITGMDVTGWVLARYLRESAGPARPPSGGGVTGGGSGPDRFVVSGLASGDLLNMRSRPSAQADIVARLANGTRVRNLGCEPVGSARWCRVQTTGSVVVTGWANARYLREG
jgi:uncharacterized protein YraI